MNTKIKEISAITAMNGSMDNTTQIHNQLREKYSEKTDGNTEADTLALMPYNGYYSLVAEGTQTQTGAFFTVDTNVVVSNGGTHIFDISLIISLDGIHSSVFSFTTSTATFNSATKMLNWTEPKGSKNGPLEIIITFQHESGDSGVTGTFTGTISIPGQPKFQGKGTTYNNLIPVSTYEGSFHDIKDPSKIDMQIMPDHILNYRNLWDLNATHPTNVGSYIYNMNMYYFSFQRGDYLIKLIMGTSSSGGLVCNDITSYDSSSASPIPRNLQTITSTTSREIVNSNDQSEELMQYSGFYNLIIKPESTHQEPPKTKPFISIEGIYTIHNYNTEYTVTIGVSIDGITTKVYTVDSNVKFDSSTNTLTILPSSFNLDPIIISFNRAGIAGEGYRSLVNITGSIEGKSFSGSTLLNPVPLMAYSGAQMTSKNNTENLSITSNDQLTYNGVVIKNLTYVPLMYIAVFDEPAGNEVFLSLGTDGGRGNTCIITDKEAAHSIDVVYAIPNGHSGQKSPPQN